MGCQFTFIYVYGRHSSEALDETRLKLQKCPQIGYEAGVVVIISKFPILTMKLQSELQTPSQFL